MRVAKSSPSVFTPLDDGTGVLLNLETRLYYSLNRTAAAVWQEIETVKHPTVDDLVRVTCERFDVDQDAARKEVLDFVERLERFRMVRTD